MMRGRREFHVSRVARARYHLDEGLFSLVGNVVIVNLRAVRALAAAMTARRRADGHPEPYVEPGALNAMGLIDEILHAVVEIYRRYEDPEAIDDALDHLDEALGATTVDAVLARFVETFPPLAVGRGELAPAEWLAGETAGVPNREVALEEVANLWLANANPAFGPFRELFDDGDLVADTAYPRLIAELGRFFAARPPFGPDRQDLVTMLRAPALAEPGSLAGQLRWIRARWGAFLAAYLGDRLLALMERLITGLDVVAEEERARWMRFHAGPSGGEGGPSFGGLEGEMERFSTDLDWMPRVVLMARSTYVWLDQLSRWHGRSIRTLDQVPDEELDRLARWGFTGLWLIGLWERSRASREIKVRRGNPDAVASAYSLRDYVIAEDLGGERAFQDLRDRAAARGIRLASDMVPNHMGIDSRWVVEHPDWFLSLAEPPYPAYSFGGPDLSDDGRVGIVIEDHYWDATDAAVVFKRVDRATGDVRYVYHGNDGTSMPWNDTAQLDYLKPEVREAVIQTILAVARRFPIIRFDAAMTLAKKHVARLWFPEPGQGGAIPSRAEHAMSKADFDAAMPVEFWREVVDRVAAEVPGTLLLAEAFWLLEGYFVRTLGMHRVYNSAFMNMLRDEKNAEYRLVIRNTLEFDPEVLKRYVNFMNNPDERTAVEQFGTGDKYFGICTLMATMPGLPMFGHGQVEGFAEKYGMEFRRAYWDERPNEALIGRHEWQVFPLLHRRWLFAEAHDFRLYDVVDDAGHVNEDVFAYSNRAGDERALVVYHNRFASMHGRIHDSVSYAVKDAGGDKHLARCSLADGLGLTASPGAVAIFRDRLAGLEYVRETSELRERGLRVSLDAYGCQVYLDWREVTGETAAEYRALAVDLAGAGVPSVEGALAERRLRPLHDAVAILANEAFVRDATEAVAAALAAAAQADAGRAVGPERPAVDVDQVADRWRSRALDCLRAVRSVVATSRSAPTLPSDDALAAAADELATRLRRALHLASASPRDLPAGDEPAAFAAVALAPETITWAALCGWLAADAVGSVLAPDAAARTARAWFDDAALGRVLADAFRWRGLDDGAAWWAVETVRHLLARPGAAALAAPPSERAGRLMRAWLSDEDLGRWLGLNRHDGVAYVNRERLEAALRWVVVMAAVAGREDALAAAHPLALQLADLAGQAGYRVGRIVELATGAGAGAAGAPGATTALEPRAAAGPGPSPEPDPAPGGDAPVAEATQPAEAAPPVDGALAADAPATPDA